MPRGSGQRPSALDGVDMVCVSPFGMYMLTNSASRTHRHCSMLAPPSGDVHVQKQVAITADALSHDQRSLVGGAIGNRGGARSRRVAQRGLKAGTEEAGR
eukprot:scaffold23544_cov60-Phaeocystis_antarctica.AAC.2